MPQSRIQYSSILTPKLKAQVQKKLGNLCYAFQGLRSKTFWGHFNSEIKLDSFVGIFSTTMEEFDVCVSNNMIHHYVNPGLKS